MSSPGCFVCDSPASVAVFASFFAFLRNASIASHVPSQLSQRDLVSAKLPAVCHDLRAIRPELSPIGFESFTVLQDFCAQRLDFLPIFYPVGASPSHGFIWLRRALGLGDYGASPNRQRARKTRAQEPLPKITHHGLHLLVMLAFSKHLPNAKVAVNLACRKKSGEYQEMYFP